MTVPSAKNARAKGQFGAAEEHARTDVECADLC
jgi:hypothetical protein